MFEEPILEIRIKKSKKSKLRTRIVRLDILAHMSRPDMQVDVTVWLIMTYNRRGVMSNGGGLEGSRILRELMGGAR